MPEVNPDILKWARTTAGFSEEQAVRRLGMHDLKDSTATRRLVALESGDLLPTRAMLVKMSKQYRRPLLTFYLSKQPRTGDRGQDYRTLPETVETTQQALVDVVSRDIRTRQALVRSVLEDEDEAVRLPFIGSLNMKQGVKAALSSLTKQLYWNLDEYVSQQNIEQAFVYLRGKVEREGIFVLLVDNLGSHHTTIDSGVFRGFALADDVAPFIAINANDSKGAWCFTLVHELVHLWLGATGVSGGSGDREIEKFCNDVASEFLLPMQEVRKLDIDNGTDFAMAKDTINQFAQSRKVSNAMVAYKLFRATLIAFERYEELQASFKEDWLTFKSTQRLKAKETEGGPNYYVTKQHRVGKALIHLVARMMYGGALTTTKAARVLGVRAQNVQGILKNRGQYPAQGTAEN